MDDWPELEDAINQRDLEKQRFLSDYEAECLIEKLDKELSIKAALMERMEPWTHLEPELRRQAAEVGDPVAALLRAMTIASLRLAEDRLSRLKLSFKLTIPDVRKPPQLCWEASVGAVYTTAWYTVRLIVDRMGVPLRYEITVLENQILTADPTIPALKAILVEAFRIWPFSSRGREREPGFDLA